MRQILFKYFKPKRGDFYHAVACETKSKKDYLNYCLGSLCGIFMDADDPILLDSTKLPKNAKVCKNCVNLAKKYLLKYYNAFSKIPGVNITLRSK